MTVTVDGPALVKCGGMDYGAVREFYVVFVDGLINDRQFSSYAEAERHYHALTTWREAPAMRFIAHG